MIVALGCSVLALICLGFLACIKLMRRVTESLEEDIEDLDKKIKQLEIRLNRLETKENWDQK